MAGATPGGAASFHRTKIPAPAMILASIIENPYSRTPFLKCPDIRPAVAAIRMFVVGHHASVF